MKNPNQKKKQSPELPDCLQNIKKNHLIFMLQYLSFHREKVINVHKAVFINIVSVVQLSIMKI